MSSSTTALGPRAAIDEGSLHDLCVDGAQVPVHTVGRPEVARAQRGSRAMLVEVPDDADQLLVGLPAYGT